MPDGLYSPKCVEGCFCELRHNGVLDSPYPASCIDRSQRAASMPSKGLRPGPLRSVVGTRNDRLSGSADVVRQAPPKDHRLLRHDGILGSSAKGGLRNLAASTYRRSRCTTTAPFACFRRGAGRPPPKSVPPSGRRVPPQGARSTARAPPCLPATPCSPLATSRGVRPQSARVPPSKRGASIVPRRAPKTRSPATPEPSRGDARLVPNH